jgi:hypothetical protein
VLRSHGRKHLEEGEGLGRAAGDRRRWLVMAGDGWWRTGPTGFMARFHEISVSKIGFMTNLNWVYGGISN